MSSTCSIEPQNPTSGDNDADAFAPGPGKHVLFFGDPMCSWCWGFSPALAQLAQQARGRAGFEVVMGGLRPGTVETWDPAMRAYIRHHWEEVAAKSGQPFDFARFDDADFVYDTEPGCRAVVAVRELDPARALPMYEALQRAFYAENINITRTDALTDLAALVGVERDRFLAQFNLDDLPRRVAFDFQRTQAFGVQGFPAVLCAEDGQYAFLTLGYRPYEAMRDDFAAWLDS